MKLILLISFVVCFSFNIQAQQKINNFKIHIEHPNLKSYNKDTTFTLDKKQLQKLFMMDSLYSTKKGIRTYVTNKNCSNMPVAIMEENVSNMPISLSKNNAIFTMPILKTDSVNTFKAK